MAHFWGNEQWRATYSVLSPCVICAVRCVCSIVWPFESRKMFYMPGKVMFGYNYGDKCHWFLSIEMSINFAETRRFFFQFFLVYSVERGTKCHSSHRAWSLWKCISFHIPSTYNNTKLFGSGNFFWGLVYTVYILVIVKLWLHQTGIHNLYSQATSSCFGISSRPHSIPFHYSRTSSLVSATKVINA